MKQESPLNQIDLSGLASTNTLSIKEVPFLDYVILRANLANQELNAAIESVLETALPLEPNTKITASNRDIFWYGPSEWLIITASLQGAVLVDKLRAVFGHMHASATEITGGNTMLEISGTAGRDLLAKGTPLDLHPAKFELGSCAQTVFAKTSATIYHQDDIDTFRLIIRRSFADYLGVWMLDAAREFVHD